MLNNAITKYDISTEEKATLVVPQSITSNSYQVHIPKLMPLITPSAATQLKIFNSKIFANDSSCEPSVSNRINLTGCITVGKLESCFLGHLSMGTIPSGTGLTIKMIGQTINEMKIMN